MSQRNKKHRVEFAVENKITTTKQRPASGNLNATIQKQNFSYQRNDMKRLKEAIQAAESVYFPSRLRLYEIYHDIENDTQVSSLVQSRKIKALGKEYQLVNKTGKTNPKTLEATELLKSSWFQDIMGLAWDSVMYGYSLIQLGPIVDGVVTSVTLVPRENVRSEEGIVVPYPGSVEGVPFLNVPWVIPAGNPNDLGLFRKVARPALMKSHALSSQGLAVELFGAPTRIATTDTTDPEHVANVSAMLNNMGTAGWGVFDETTKLQLLDSMSRTGQSPHKVLIEYLDGQISKAVFGQTMMSDNGSSRSQSEVHERLGNDYTLWDIQFLERTVNDNILPRLVELGFPLNGMRFEYLKGENADVLFARTTELLKAGVGIDLDWIEETFGVKLSKQAKEEEKNGPTDLGAENDGPTATGGAKDAAEAE